MRWRRLQRIESACVQGGPATPGRPAWAGDWDCALPAVLLPKHNPIEHRLFAHVTRACQGVTFHSVAIARKFMAMTNTTTGLKVTVDVLDGVYVKGKKVAADFLENMRIVFDAHLPRWNYLATPADA